MDHELNKGYMSRFMIVILLLLIVSVEASASQCGQLLSQHLESSQVRPLTFPEVEVYRRNNNFGVQQSGRIQFEKWIEIIYPKTDTEAFIGIAEDQRVYQVVQSKSRKIARLLGGNQNMEEIFVYGHEILIGVDQLKRIYFYSPDKWLRSPIKQIALRNLLIWGGATTASAAAFGFGWNLSPEDAMFYTQISSGMTAMSLLFQTINQFDRENTYPSGWVDSGLIFSDLEKLKSDLSQLNIGDLETYFSNSHFSPPEMNKLLPPLPEEATEDIR